MLGEEDATHPSLKEIGQRFFASMYGQSLGTTMREAHYSIYSRKKGKSMCILALPFTVANLYLHVRRAHLQMIMWKAADQRGPPQVDITQFYCEMKGGIPSPCGDTGLLTPLVLLIS